MSRRARSGHTTRWARGAPRASGRASTADRPRSPRGLARLASYGARWAAARGGSLGSGAPSAPWVQRRRARSRTVNGRTSRPRTAQRSNAGSTSPDGSRNTRLAPVLTPRWQVNRSASEGCSRASRRGRSRRDPRSAPMARRRADRIEACRWTRTVRRVVRTRWPRRRCVSARPARADRRSRRTRRPGWPVRSTTWISVVDAASAWRAAAP